LIRKDWGEKLGEKRLYVVENIEGLFAERMQEMTAFVAGAQDGRGTEFLMTTLLRRSWRILLLG
jgi:hypothetical protein